MILFVVVEGSGFKWFLFFGGVSLCLNIFICGRFLLLKLCVMLYKYFVFCLISFFYRLMVKIFFDFLVNKRI